MSPGALQLVGTIVTALLALGGIWLSTRQVSRKSATDAAQKLFEEVQEERGELKKERDQLKKDVAALITEHREDRERFDSELRELRERERRRDDFIQDLRNHIRLDKGPPPPDWPEELR